MFSWFENLIDAFPKNEPQQPPRTLLAFCWHYSKEIWPALATVSALGAAVALLEVMVFGFLGNVVEWLTTADRTTFLEKE